MIKLPADPSLQDLQVLWEKQFWYKSRTRWELAARSYESYKLFFGADRKPRDIFRSDVAEFKQWLIKKGRSRTTLNEVLTFGSRLYRFLDELEVIEKDFNPFEGMAPRRIRNHEKTNPVL